MRRLGEYGIEPLVVDPWADPEAVSRELGISLRSLDEAKGADCVIHAVSHREFSELGAEGLRSLLGGGDLSRKVVIDVKGQWPVDMLEDMGVVWWRM